MALGLVDFGLCWLGWLLSGWLWSGLALGVGFLLGQFFTGLALTQVGFDPGWLCWLFIALAFCWVVLLLWPRLAFGIGFLQRWLRAGLALGWVGFFGGLDFKPDWL